MPKTSSSSSTPSDSSNTMINIIDCHDHHAVRKRRVGKACDHCRIKKTKVCILKTFISIFILTFYIQCDGHHPCHRCILDNKICTYSDRKKTKDKTYPSGYVELLETRIDLLSRALEKLVDLSINNKDLSFLKNSTSSTAGNNNKNFSINWVIELLINEFQSTNTNSTNDDNENQLLISARRNLNVLVKQQMNSPSPTTDSNTNDDESIDIKDENNNEIENENENENENLIELEKEKLKQKDKLKKQNRKSITIKTGTRGRPRKDSTIRTIRRQSPSLSIKQEFSQDSNHDTKTSPTKLNKPKELNDLDTNLLNLGITTLGLGSLGPYQSGAAIAAAAMNGSLSMSDFEGSLSDNGYNSPLCTSPFSENEFSIPIFNHNNNNNNNNSISSNLNQVQNQDQLQQGVLNNGNGNGNVNGGNNAEYFDSFSNLGFSNDFRTETFKSLGRSNSLSSHSRLSSSNSIKNDSNLSSSSSTNNIDGYIHKPSYRESIESLNKDFTLYPNSNSNSSTNSNSNPNPPSLFPLKKSSSLGNINKERFHKRKVSRHIHDITPTISTNKEKEINDLTINTNTNNSNNSNNIDNSNMDNDIDIDMDNKKNINIDLINSNLDDLWLYNPSLSTMTISPQLTNLNSVS